MKTSAEVSISLEIRVVIGQWDLESNFAAISDQAVREAKEKVRKALSTSSGITVTNAVGYHVSLGGKF